MSDLTRLEAGLLHFWGLRPSADWDWVWDWDWVALGSPKRHPRVAQASRKGHAWVELKKWQ